MARHLVRDPYLIVSVARDANVAAIKKDTPDFSERKRMSFIRKTGLADRVILGGAGDHIRISCENGRTSSPSATTSGPTSKTWQRT